MKFSTFLLEDWFNKHYFDTELVLCESGVESFSFKDLRTLLSISQAELDTIVFTDSPVYGTTGLRQAIASRWRDGDCEQVLVTHGSSEGMFLAMSALLKPGDEVVALTPCYQPFFSIPEALGCTVHRWQLRPEERFEPDLDALERVLTSRTRLVVVNFPNNPTGASLTLEQQERLVNAVAATNAYLLWDAAFTELSYDTPPLPDPWRTYPRTITLGTLTKAYGLSGMRIGWCLAPADVLEQCIHIREYITLNLSPLTQYLGQRVVESIEVLLSLRLKQSRRNREILSDWVTRHDDLIDWVSPQGGVSAFLRMRGLDDTDEFCRSLAQSHGVFLLPGKCFEHPAYIRLGFGYSTAVLQEGLTRVSHFLRHSSSFTLTL